MTLGARETPARDREGEVESSKRVEGNPARVTVKNHFNGY